MAGPDDGVTTGIVVAGGTSSRFGPEEKALATVGGTPMLRRVVDGLAPRVDRVVVNARLEQRPAFSTALADAAGSIRFAIDGEPDGGPVAGLATALDGVDGGRAVVLACDLPLVGTETLASLLDAFGTVGGAAATDCVLPIVDGRPQPLCGVYAVDGVDAALDSLGTPRNRPLGELLDRLRVSTVSTSTLPAGPHSFANVNTRADLRTARRIAAAPRDGATTASR